MFDPRLIQEAANRLDTAERSRQQVGQFSLDYPDIAIEDAYATQRAWAERKIADGRAFKGHKIDLTPRAMRVSLNISEPDYGLLLNDMFSEEGSDIPFQRFIMPRVEVELTFIPGKPLKGPGCTLFDVLEATEWVTSALEITDARIQQADSQTKVTRKVFDTISDNAANADVVMGGRAVWPGDIDLRRVPAILHRNGAIGESGASAAVLNHSAKGAARLANKLAPYGVYLETGQVIFDDSFTHPVVITSGDIFHVDYDLLGSISCRFVRGGISMDLPVNRFKQCLRSGEAQIGLWLGPADPYCVELAANAGFGWLLLDDEYAPSDLCSLLGQLQALASYPGQPVIRPVQGDTALIRQLLGIGVQTPLVPMADSAAQAEGLMCAVRYPPADMHGVGSALAQASRWNSVAECLDHADEQMCLLAQVENLESLANLDTIAVIEGVDGVFIGPVDLSAAMGHRGNPGHPEVQAAIEDAIRRIRAAGKAAGTLSADEALVWRYLELGCAFVAVSVDTSLLMRSPRELAGRFKGGALAPSVSSSAHG